MPSQAVMPRVWVLAPGSGPLVGALLSVGHCVSFSIEPDFDVNGRRYPEGWLSMHGVALTESEAEETLTCFRRNLATLASAIYDPMRRSAKAVDLSSHLANRAEPLYEAPTGRSQAWYDRHLAWEEGQPVQAFAVWRSEGAFDCLVCGSRAGQVTLPALWLLGCCLPAVVVNSGCARPEIAWAWPEGVPVVLVAGGRDFFAGDFRGDRDGHIGSLWEAVPEAARALTAIYYVPHMGHSPSNALLEELLPTLVRYAVSMLSPEAKPTTGIERNCWLVTSGCPEGECLPPRYLVEAEQIGDTDGRGSTRRGNGLVNCLRHCGCLPL